MMQDNENARPDVGASERAKMEAGTGQATTSKNHDTTANPQGQAVKVADFLSPGQQNAVPLKHLKGLLHQGGREIRLMIRAERLRGVPICEDSKSGYYLPKNADERDLCAKRLRHRAAQIIKVADAIAAADILEEADA